MSLKKQIGIFLGFCLIFAALYAAFNMLVDPFGIFGDVIFDYYEYDMTENPRLAKIAYIDKHHSEYDSYIFGCSKTSSYPISELNEYTGAKFYNMFAYGGDLHDIEQMASYILENYGDECKNLILAMGPEAAYRYDSEDDAYKDNMHAKVDPRVNKFGFYAKYLFLNPSYAADKIKSYFTRGYLIDSTNVFIAETGAYNKLRRDTMPISDTEKYYADMAGSEFEITYSRPLKYTDEAVASVKAIKEKCDSLGVKFTLIGSPMYDAEIKCYDRAELAELAEKLCDVTDFYNFWGYNTFSHDARFFYDGYHFRNCVGSSALSYIYGGDRYVPEGFGRYSTKETISAQLPEMLDENVGRDEKISVKVPILMYHALTEDAEEASDTIITVEAFEEQIKTLSEDGFTALFYRDLLDFAEKGTDLPEKSVVITFDDGYESNISLAAPVLEKYGMCGSVSVIGISVGKDTYKDTGVQMYPHFGFDSAKAEYEKGTLDFQSHTYDMHMNSLDTDFRDGMLPKKGESEDEYINALRSDFARSKSELEDGIGNDVFVITYPFGKYTDLTDTVLAEAGAKVSVTVEGGINEITKGLPQSLRQLRRLNMTSEISGGELLRTLSAYLYD